MGIPKFYRWISERYPCLSEKIREYQIPEFDNLYLDMNGIIHNCSHPNDEDIHLRIPEETIFREIFKYIDFLFKMIKPRKVFFMAVDGVAPRAKMNQQRGRRFRSARLAEDQEAEAIKKGETLPTEERFDSNCITPGTEFMARLHFCLQYFVQVKVSTDPLWQRKGLRIYLSGHDVPGEGEHKIMDFIRHIRSQENYDPETRHCLYGLDADLIMLGLSTHELRFSLLREEVKFTQNRKHKKKTPILQSKPGTSYDFTNVSVFTSDPSSNPMANSSLELQAATAKSLTDPNKSYADMTKHVQEINVNYGLNKKEDSGNEFLPLPIDDKYAKGTYRPPIPEKTTFLLLHLSLLRDYIDEEFQDLRHELEGHPCIKYDLEKVIDDWILLSILVGNDFIPHLPQLHIVKGAFPMLYQTYARLLPSMDGYLNENGTLNLKRFEIFLIELSKFDLDVFRDTYDDMKYMESKTGKPIVLGEKMFEDFTFEEDNFVDEEPLEGPLKDLVNRTNEEIFGQPPESNNALCRDIFTERPGFFSEEDSPEFQLEFLQHKRNYYAEKMDIQNLTKEILDTLAFEYIRAIQWILFYYYKGVASWGWYYPSHYAPYASDICTISHFKISFDKGEPFKPFEQLLGVLPAQSGKLLPKCFMELMINEKSPILDFYPKTFDNDLNGKRNDWEAVVLIPFIEEQRLLQAMQNAQKLTPEEAYRNTRGSLHCFEYTEEDSGVVRCPGDLFPALQHSSFKDELIFDVQYNPETLPKGVHPKAKIDKIYQGFPTLKSIEHTSILDKDEIKVFEFTTREESLILTIKNSENPSKTKKLAEELLGTTIWVNWPHLTLAQVTGVSDNSNKYIRLCGSAASPIVSDPNYDGRIHEKLRSSLKERHLKFKGIRLDDIDVVIWAKTMEGRKLKCNHKGEVVVEIQWGRYENYFTLQTTIRSQDVTEIFYLDQKLHKSFTDIFKQGDKVFKLNFPYFGSLGRVAGIHFNELTVEFESLVEDTEENLTEKLGKGVLKSRDYFTTYEVAQRCGVSNFIVAKITGTVYVNIDKKKKVNSNKQQLRLKNNDSNPISSTSPDSDSDTSTEDVGINHKKRSENIGLNLKFNKRNKEVRGYTRKNDNQWLYSVKTVNLIQDYMEAFPELFTFLSRNASSKDCYNASEIFPNNTLENMDRIFDWLNAKGIHDFAHVPVNSNILDDDDVHDVWTYVLENKINQPKLKKAFTLKPSLLFKPGLNRGCVPAQRNEDFFMLDRVICVDTSGPVPLGQRGTIIGIQNPENAEQQEEESFRSTSATVLNTLLVLCDPIQDIFDQTEEKASRSSTKEGNKTIYFDPDQSNELSNRLRLLLKLGGNNSVAASNNSQLFSGFSNNNQAQSASKSADEPKKPSRTKPVIVTLYPFQVLNLSQNEARAEADRRQKSVQSASVSHQNQDRPRHSNPPVVRKTEREYQQSEQYQHQPRTSSRRPETRPEPQQPQVPVILKRSSASSQHQQPPTAQFHHKFQHPATSLQLAKMNPNQQQPTHTQSNQNDFNQHAHAARPRQQGNLHQQQKQTDNEPHPSMVHSQVYYRRPGADPPQLQQNVQPPAQKQMSVAANPFVPTKVMMRNSDQRSNNYGTTTHPNPPMQNLFTNPAAATGPRNSAGAVSVSGSLGLTPEQIIAEALNMNRPPTNLPPEVLSLTAAFKRDSKLKVFQ